ncbi:hypothetical protein L7F22_016306 [Adiantum nelumboides]|nr:hypothetical protein [Adiantum nelumboides]
MNKDDRSLQECNERIRIKQECREDAPCSTPKTLLFGFSKGGVVLNQLLSEMSYMAKHDVVKAADASSSGLLLRFHGTPRQWKDPQRPWIATEKEPNLQMHFEILESFDLV